jgi:hypothetical protein
MFDKDGIETGMDMGKVMDIARDACAWLGREADSCQIRVKQCQEAKASG